MRNHTATHLLQAALIQTLGSHIKQAGSHVNSQRLRFDFTHTQALTKEDKKNIEILVNKIIQKSIPLKSAIMTKEEALKKGALALFGEKYSDSVRVIEVPHFSIELCGGTHVNNTSEISLFSITSESSLSSGIRRIEAITSQKAFQRVQEKTSFFEDIELLTQEKNRDAINKVQSYTKEIKKLKKELQQQKEKSESSDIFKDLFENMTTLSNGMTYKVFSTPQASHLKKLGDKFIETQKNGVLLAYSTQGDKSLVLLKTYKNNPSIHCSNLLNKTLIDMGGKGGGRADMAQGSLDSSKIQKFQDIIKKNLDKSL